MSKPFTGLCVAAGVLGLAAPEIRGEDTAWVPIHNGRNLEGWTPYFKVTGLKNTDSTFQFTPEGDLYVNQRQSKATTGFGHLFYTKKKLSYYMARARYRFTSETNAPGFTGADQPQNNGFMIHSQDPATMNGREFPTSAECQLLGPKNALFLRPAQGYPVGTTANLCASNITVSLRGSDFSGGSCQQPTYPAAWRNTNIPWEDTQGWSDILVRVLGDSLIEHWVHGVKVMEYTRIRSGGAPLREGYLAIQAEGSSTIFRNFEYVELTGCMDRTKPGYRTYFVKNDPSKCETTAAGPRSGSGPAPGLVREGAMLAVRGEAVIADIRRTDGSKLSLRPGSREFAPDRAGIYWITLQGPAGRHTRRIAWH